MFNHELSLSKEKTKTNQIKQKNFARTVIRHKNKLQDKKLGIVDNVGHPLPTTSRSPSNTGEVEVIDL